MVKATPAEDKRKNISTLNLFPVLLFFIVLMSVMKNLVPSGYL